MIPDTTLAEWREISEKATPGPWWSMAIEGAAAFNEWDQTVIAAPHHRQAEDTLP